MKTLFEVVRFTVFYHKPLHLRDWPIFFCTSVVSIQNICLSLFTTEYIALYPYSSVEPGDLTFNEGEEILVTQKDGEWWTGSIGERTGIFPSNYVKPKDQEVVFFSLKQTHSVVTNQDSC